MICDISKPMIGKDFINISSQLKHTYKKYDKFDEEIKNKVKIILDYILLIWANSNKEVFDYLMKWFVNMVKGNKKDLMQRILIIIL